MVRLRRSLGPTERGSTEPIMLVDAEDVTWLVKLQPAPMLDHVAELVANALARAEGLAVPEGRIGRLEPELVAAMTRGSVQEQRLASAARQLGAEVFVSRWLDAEDVTSAPEEDEFLRRLYAFDLLIHNPDRTPGHPNLLRVGGELVAMDHAQGLPWCRDQVPGAAELLHVAQTRGLQPARLTLSERDVRAAVETLPHHWLPAARREALVDGLVDRLAWVKERTG